MKATTRTSKVFPRNQTTEFDKQEAKREPGLYIEISGVIYMVHMPTRYSVGCNL